MVGESEQVQYREVGCHRVFQGGYLAIDRLQTLENQRPFQREVVRHPDGVAILALDGGNRVALVRQARPALGLVTLEIPAGSREPGEEALTAARRELAEETGAEGGEWSHLGRLAHAEGYSSAWVDLFFARGVTIGQARPEVQEELRTVWVDLTEYVRMVRSGDFCDAKSLVAGFRALAGLVGPEDLSRDRIAPR